ncbi:MAG: PhzF family phenazine biosynthesis protein [Lewinellaceae bacterium]|nr:PhzF family phenazine biosynthesis protein [Lewinellaceae bacterium]
MLKTYQVDAFTHQLYGGNPAAVVPLEQWLPDELMQQIAAENNLSETAFFIALPDSGTYHIRWFTPVTEVDLCGHATLASAWVIFNRLEKDGAERISLQSRSGWLHVRRHGDWLELDFPADTLQPAVLDTPVLQAIGGNPISIHKGREDYLLEFGSESEILALEPDFMALRKYPSRGFIATAPGDHVDFVSRCFYPAFGIDEDPATGSAHTTLTPFWHQKTNTSEFSATQLSKRRGTLHCILDGDRVRISGQAVLYLEGVCQIP